MRKALITLAIAAIAIVSTSCGSTHAGAGGYDTGMGVNLRDRNQL